MRKITACKAYPSAHQKLACFHMSRVCNMRNPSCSQKALHAAAARNAESASIPRSTLHGTQGCSDRPHQSNCPALSTGCTGKSCRAVHCRACCQLAAANCRRWAGLLAHWTAHIGLSWSLVPLQATACILGPISDRGCAKCVVT